MSAIVWFRKRTFINEILLILHPNSTFCYRSSGRAVNYDSHKKLGSYFENVIRFPLEFGMKISEMVFAQTSEMKLKSLYRDCSKSRYKFSKTQVYNLPAKIIRALLCYLENQRRNFIEKPFQQQMFIKRKANDKHLGTKCTHSLQMVHNYETMEKLASPNDRNIVVSLLLALLLTYEKLDHNTCFIVKILINMQDCGEVWRICEIWRRS